jgi:hypothetical protein
MWKLIEVKVVIMRWKNEINESGKRQKRKKARLNKRKEKEERKVIWVRRKEKDF